MKIFGLLLIALLTLTVCGEAQTKKHHKILTTSSRIKSAKKPPRTISAGVINGRAIDLIRPEYPKSARAVNIYGQVNVRVLIDENGEVVSARAESGNLFLLSAAVNAALKSRFEPLTLSGEPVRVSGIINYNFMPQEWNWLEIGYALNNSSSSCYSADNLAETLPAGFEEEKQLLRQFIKSSENQNELSDILVASINGKLDENEKSKWLFLVGLTLRKINQNCCLINEDLQNSIEKIRFLLQFRPANISPILVSNLEKFILTSEMPPPAFYNSTRSGQIHIFLKNLEQKFPYAGI